MTTQLHIISSMATRQLLSALLAQYEQQQGNSEQRVAIRLESVGGVDAAKRVAAGEAFDGVVLAANAIDQLIAGGHIRAGSRVDLVQSGVAIAVKAGSACPDVSSEEAVKQAVMGAATLSYSTGPSGVYLAKLFERWGIAEQIQNRIVQAPPGVPVGSLVASGEVELGFQQLSELLPLQGITILGGLPPAIQVLTHFSAGVATRSQHPAAVQALFAYLASPTTAQTKIAHGMSPA